MMVCDSESNEPNDDDNNKSETTLFAEHEQARGLVSVLVSDATSISTHNNNSSNNNGSHERLKALTSLRSILDRYLEARTLLDPYLATLVTPLAEYCQNHLTSDMDDAACAMSAIYSVCKVRGRKRIMRFLPHSVDLVQPVLADLMRLSSSLLSSSLSLSSTSVELSLVRTNTNDALLNNRQQQEHPNENPPLWERIYILWMWLELWSLTPFDRRLVLTDSTVLSLIQLAKQHLAEAGPVRDTAAACLASWLSRQDMDEHRNEFCEWSRGILEDCIALQGKSRDVFRPLGILQTLAATLNVGTRSNYQAQIILWPCMLDLAEQHRHPNVLLRKYLTKWLARMGCAHMPPRIASWRYQRGGRTSLLENLLGNAEHTNKCTDETNCPSKDDNQDELFEVPDPVEDVMGHLLLALKDNATVVRWSAAKGIGRLTERLPIMCAHDVLDALVDQLKRNKENDMIWHGSCLALGELARRGLLLPDRLPDVIEPILVPAILFDVRKGQTSVGSHVRDSACYAYWAFARAYSPTVLRPHVDRMSESLVIASLFDREINCRRAASAAFQESVGRQGAQNFPHGIDILTAADYYTLGNRHESYTTIATFIASFAQYRRPIIDHLQTVKLFHWDIEIRVLASKSLHSLSRMDKEFTVETVMPNLLERSTNSDVFVRHGSVVGLSEIVLALKDELPDELKVELAELVPKIEKLRLYRGRGGEIMRAAVCRYIECLSLAKVPLTVKQQVRLLDSVDENLKHPNETIQQAAGAALAALMRSYFPVRETGPSDRLQQRVVDKYTKLVNTSDNPAETRGFALALGSLPKKLLAPSSPMLDSVLGCLIAAARPDATVGQQGDAETRRNAIQALMSVTREVGFSESICPPTVGMSSQHLGHVFESFLLGLQDYNTDRRGDIGSWSRIASMTGLEHLTSLAMESNIDIDIGLITRIYGGFLKQLAEKLDKVRLHAGSCIEKMLKGQLHRESEPTFCNKLRESLQIEKETNWSDAKVTFRRVVKVLNNSEFFHIIISGLVVSVGALTESVTKEAENALIEWIRDTDRHGRKCRVLALGTSFLAIFHENKRRGRVILPLLKTLEKLSNRNLLDDLLSTTETQFASSLLSCLHNEMRDCVDMHRLLSGVNVALGLLSPLNEIGVNRDVLSFMIEMLGHEFPRVRKHTADSLYVRLLEDPSVLPKQENESDVVELLLQGQWQSDLIGEVGIAQLCAKTALLIGVEYKLSWSRAETRKQAAGPREDDFSSYASLVNATIS